ncbi:MAG TPA: hypothetical protein VFH88_02530 [Candidatus Krumholzibacteria bacterium]|nr:hypothetical protein [Candidatus Krumholzibacteria bacterium]
MKRILLAAVIVIAAGSSGYFAMRAHRAERQLGETVKYTHSLMDSLSNTVRFPPPPVYADRDSLYWKWVAINAQMNLNRFVKLAREQAMMRHAVFDEGDIAHLKNEGLTDPVRELRESLMTRADLIPYPAVLGGTMSFDESDVVLLTPPYVFAPFEDGHVAGSMLLSYQITGGKIEWKRLWAELM